jgi:hypothetical protein
MKCFNCNEFIVTDDHDYFSLQQKSLGPTALYFHTGCFEAIAGPEFALHLNAASIMCLICFSKPMLGGKVKTCSECTARAPSCPQCAMPNMVLRVNKSNSGVFWACPGYPGCKKTLSVR